MPVISGGQLMAPSPVIYKSVLITETTGAGTYTASVEVPAGSFLVDVIVHAIAVWTATTSAIGIVGDVANDDGIFAAIDMKATDLELAEGLHAMAVASSGGGKVGADLANNQWNRRYLATARTVSMKVTTLGAAGDTGRTLFTVAYTDPSQVGDATKA